MKRSIVSPGFVKRTLAKLLKLDQQLGIVVDGNVASQAIAVGNYVNLINSTITGKTDGIYVATGAVSSGGTVTASDISGNALAKGISNELSEQIGTLSDVLHTTPVTIGSGGKAISGLTTGDIVIFTRNCSGMVTVSGNGTLATVITLSGVSNPSFSNNVLTFSLTSSYSCDFTVLHRGEITIS